MVSEAITLAQLVRLVVLGRALDPARYEVHFASAQFPGLIFERETFTRWCIFSVERGYVDRALATGGRLYSKAILERYVKSDLAVLDAVQPDLVVGDFRWSLSVSAALRQVPTATLINAYWSPYAQPLALPVPDHPLTRLFGHERVAQWFPKAAPFVFRHFAEPLNALRRQHGLAPVGSLREVLCHGSFTLYADTPQIAPTRPDLPASHRYLGPVLWSAPGTLPEDWGADPQRMAVYVTLGSSGATRGLPALLAALSELPVDVLVATAGRANPKPRPGVWIREYVPGDQAVARAQLVIANGGSTTAYQALAAGTPVLGVPYNLDQHLTMAAIERAGAGVSLRTSQLDRNRVRALVARALHDGSLTQGARTLAADFAHYHAPTRFADFVAHAVTAPAPRPDTQGAT